MKPPPANLFVWIGGHAAWVRVTGRANFATSVEFKRLLRHLEDTGCRRVVLELSECLLMDSTFLGVLAHEAGQRAVKDGDRTQPGLELVNPGERVRELIDDLGVAHLFSIINCEPLRETFQVVPGAEGVSREELARTCLEAHELLMELNPANVSKFKDVARFFAEELKRTGGSQPPP